MPKALQPIKLPAHAVLRRNTQILQLEMVIEDSAVEMMRGDGSLDNHITEEEWDEIEGIGTSMRTHYMVDLMLSKNEDAIQRWVTILAKNLHTARFSDLLRYEILNERGELKPDAIKMDEAAMIVHREFGTSKRLSQFEKKLLQRIIAQKTQIYDRMYKREVERLQRCIEEEKLRAKQKEQYANELTDKLQQYFRDNAAKIKRLTDVTGSVSDDPEQYGLTRHNLDYPELMCLQNEVAGTLDLASKALMEMDGYKDEKSRALQALGRLRKSADVPLDDQIQTALDQLAREIIANKTSATAHDEDVRELSESIDGLRMRTDNDLVNKDKLVAKLKKDLEEMSAALQEWTGKTANLREKVRARQEEIDDWRTRLELLDRGKRLKTIHRRDGYTLEGDLAHEAEEVLTDSQYNRPHDSLGPMAFSRSFNGGTTNFGLTNGHRRHGLVEAPASSQSSRSSVFSGSSRDSGAASRRSTQSLPPLSRRGNPNTTNGSVRN